MAKRPPLKSNVAKPADTAAKVAEAERITGQLTGKAQAAPAAPQDSDEIEMQTVSYVLPVEMIDLLSQLAALRLERDKMQKRAHRRAIAAAKKANQAPPVEPPMQARRSASAIVREALEAHRAAIEAEIEDLK